MGKAIVILIVLFILIPIALFFVLRWSVLRLVGRRHGEKHMQRITKSGLALYSCLTLVLVLFAAAYTLQPNGPLGRFLHDPAGFAAAIVFTIGAVSVAETCLRKFGSPTTHAKDDGGI